MIGRHPEIVALTIVVHHVPIKIVEAARQTNSLTGCVEIIDSYIDVFTCLPGDYGVKVFPSIMFGVKSLSAINLF